MKWVARKHKEVAVIEAILGTIAVLLVIGVVWYAWGVDKQAHQTLQPTTQDAAPVRSVRVVSGQQGFDITIPRGWKVTNYLGANELFATDIAGSNGRPQVTRVEGAYTGTAIPRFAVQQFDSNEAVNFVDRTYDSEPFTSGELQGTRYYKHFSSNVTRAQRAYAYPGMQSYVYEFTKDDSSVYVRYNIFNLNSTTKSAIPGFTQSDTDQRERVESVIKTLKIKN